MFKQLWKKKEESSSIPENMTLEQVRDALLLLLDEESNNHYRMGQLFNHVVDHNLAEAEGYKNAQDYFTQNIRQVSPAALYMYGRVAREFSADTCRQFGTTRLCLLLTYEEAADLKVNHEEPGGTFIEVPKEKGEVKPTLFSECSVDELRKAIQRKRKPSSSKPLPSEDVALADKYMQAVTARFKKGDPIRMQVRNHKGTPVLDFRGIPLAQVGKLAEALLAQPLPVREVRQEEKAPRVN
jgi:hypothetical protein